MIRDWTGRKLTVREYAREAATTDRFRDDPPNARYDKLCFGLFGEVGGLLSALKKVRRDKLQTTESQAAELEIGDTLWYLVIAAGGCGVTPEVLGNEAVQQLRSRLGERVYYPAGDVSFRELDALAELHSSALRDRESLLRQAAHMTGLATGMDFARTMREPLEHRASMFGTLLAQLAALSVSFGLQLEQVAQKNLDKIFDRWLQDPRPKDYVIPEVKGEPFEQFPPKLEVEFLDRKVGARNIVVQRIKGINIGDPLTDNSHKPDGYRYHDVFHLAYAVHLGWSPVIRALLKLKRKSDGKVDENEDGARAIIIEEGIATWIFNDAKRQKLYREIDYGRLDYSLLRQVRSMVDGFEVAKAPLWQWERAILNGFEVFRQLHDARRGLVTADLRRHTLTFTPLPL